MYYRLIKYLKILLIIVILSFVLLFSISCISKISGLDHREERNEEHKDENTAESNGDFEGLYDFKKMTLKIIYEITLTGKTQKIEFTSTIPVDYEHRQEILKHNFSVEPAKIYSASDNTYARFIFNNPPEHFFVGIDTEMEIYDFDLTEASDNIEKLREGEDSSDKIEEYLIQEPNLEINDPVIKAAASNFSSASQMELVREIYYFVLEHMTYYGYDPGDNGAADAFKAGGGDCTEYSDLFVTLCRANDIPARVIEGYVADADPGELSLGHNWSEVYFEDLGWIPFDTIYDDNNGDSRSTTFDNLKNIYIYTGFKRNDAELFNYHYYAYVYYGDDIEVRKEVSIIDTDT